MKTLPQLDVETEPYLRMMDRIKEAQDVYYEAREKGEGKFEALHSARNEIKEALRAKEEYEAVLAERPEESEEPELATDPELEELAVEELEIDDEDEGDPEDEGEPEDDETLAERLWGEDPELVLPEE